MFIALLIVWIVVIPACVIAAASLAGWQRRRSDMAPGSRPVSPRAKTAVLGRGGSIEPL